MYPQPIDYWMIMDENALQVALDSATERYRTILERYYAAPFPERLLPFVHRAYTTMSTAYDVWLAANKYPIDSQGNSQ